MMTMHKSLIPSALCDGDGNVIVGLKLFESVLPLF